MFALAFPVFLLAMIIEAVVMRKRGLPGYDMPDALTSMTLGGLSLIAGTFSRLFGFGLLVLAQQKLGVAIWPTDIAIYLVALLWLLAIIFHDFSYYWVHRFSHEINILWAAHSVHHSSEHFNLSTALRQSSTTGFFSWIVFAPMAILGVPPIMMATVALIDSLYQYWVHTEQIGRLGWMEKIFVTPSNHRVHHSQNDYCIDTNYGGIFIIWDRMFGTFADERQNEKLVYGIRKAVRSYNPISANLYLYRELFRQAARTPGWRQKIQLWLSPPGGWDNEMTEPFDAAGFVRYGHQTSSGVLSYVVVHTAAMSFMVAHWLLVQTDLTPAMRVSYAAAILVSGVSIAGFLQGSGWRFQLEAIRLTALIVAMVAGLFGFGATIWSLAIAPILAGLVYCLVWVLREMRSETEAATTAVPAE